MSEARPDRAESSARAWNFACPTCQTALDTVPDGLHCPTCQITYPQQDGIWQLLSPTRSHIYARFLREYHTVRTREGWGRPEAQYYRQLPTVPPSDPQAAIWRIRQKTFHALVDRVIQPFEKSSPFPLKILDLGAGNSWLTNRLAGRGHCVTAIDISLSESDGLGARRHYTTSFTSVQAEFDRLPFLDHQADLILFNGAIHYSSDYTQTLKEAIRVLHADGALLILDTPIYHAQASGEQMVKEREAQYRNLYGFPSNALPTESFLTFEKLQTLGAVTGITWQFIRPFYGLAWEMRYLRAKLLRKREPARFMIIFGTRA